MTGSNITSVILTDTKMTCRNSFQSVILFNRWILIILRADLYTQIAKVFDPTALLVWKNELHDEMLYAALLESQHRSLSMKTYFRLLTTFAKKRRNVQILNLYICKLTFRIVLIRIFKIKNQYFQETEGKWVDYHHQIKRTKFVLRSW